MDKLINCCVEGKCCRDHSNTSIDYSRSEAERNSSDYPFTRSPGVGFLLERMDMGVKENFSDEEIEKIYHKNAERLLSKSSTR